ncbi:hypothetical protein [Paraburkholderia caribensis]|uniref:hypothetical protein n=1 Tax=Paraburkholderia caribensis TaxID=75105 RepID=UPI0005606132|nr:hypothetical protein [Paraburkholderia caribensis]
MDTIEQALAGWRRSLLARFEVGGLYSRNPTAHKWKAPFRSLMLREVVFWRLHDLLTQSYTLHQQGHGLGARILLRSGVETLSILIYLNKLTEDVLNGILPFHEFSKKTSSLLLGSRNGMTSLSSINIVTVLEKCDKLYPGLMAMYADLCESAHPNYEGMCMGYSHIDYEEHVIEFSNHWTEMYDSRHLESMRLCMMTFDEEYNQTWPKLFERLEAWIEKNDVELEATKPS